MFVVINTIRLEAYVNTYAQEIGNERFTSRAMQRRSEKGVLPLSVMESFKG